ncbi:MAG: Glu/Leu/Phe/Val dehydrogenase [Paenibacillaceae bacterium]|jgi:glutamate dehydrogenase (NAD(P)+)|nr:Glu/Leu/Phe/Val dehydrogenase [Paenibacillaceae bacterium]
MEKPYLVLEWNDQETGATGWVVVHRFVNGYASGGIRMHPTVTRQEVERLARIMSYKYEASESLTTGGCKAGIAYDYKAADAMEVLRRFLTAMRPYLHAGVSLGGDLGVSFESVLQIMSELQVELITPAMQQDPHVLEGLRVYKGMLEETVDLFPLNDAVTGYGTAFCADEAWKGRTELREQTGPQEQVESQEEAKLQEQVESDIAGGSKASGSRVSGDKARVVIQGFGCVGASCAYKLHQLGYRVVGIADANIMVTCESGLDVPALVKGRQRHGELAPGTFDPGYSVLPNTRWLDVECDILIPAALDDVIDGGNAHTVRASLIVEGANIPVSPTGDAILKARGIHVVNDFVANLGAIRFYDAVIFGKIRSGAAEVIDDIERLCRRNTSRLLAEAARLGLYQRDAAELLFQPKRSS